MNQPERELFILTRLAMLMSPVRLRDAHFGRLWNVASRIQGNERWQQRAVQVIKRNLIQARRAQHRGDYGDVFGHFSMVLRETRRLTQIR
jgi:hypothetical protein